MHKYIYPKMTILRFILFKFKLQLQKVGKLF